MAHVTLFNRGYAYHVIDHVILSQLSFPSHAKNNHELQSRDIVEQGVLILRCLSYPLRPPAITNPSRSLAEPRVV